MDDYLATERAQRLQRELAARLAKYTPEQQTAILAHLDNHIRQMFDSAPERIADYDAKLDQSTTVSRQLNGGHRS